MEFQFKEDKKVMEVDDGECMRMYLKPLTCTLKNYDGKLHVMSILPQ